jgi:hypothetical protein
MAHISKMVLGVNIVMRQKSLGGEVVDEATVLEVIMDLLGLFLVICTTDVFLPLLGKASPLGLRKSVKCAFQTMIVIQG